MLPDRCLIQRQGHRVGVNLMDEDTLVGRQGHHSSCSTGYSNRKGVKELFVQNLVASCDQGISQPRSLLSYATSDSS